MKRWVADPLGPNPPLYQYFEGNTTTLFMFPAAQKYSYYVIVYNFADSNQKKKRENIEFWTDLENG